MTAPTRYHALLKMCGMACEQAAATRTENSSEFWANIAAALEDDCPEQSAAALQLSVQLRTAEALRQQFTSCLP